MPPWSIQEKWTALSTTLTRIPCGGGAVQVTFGVVNGFRINVSVNFRDPVARWHRERRLRREAVDPARAVADVAQFAPDARLEELFVTGGVNLA